MEGKETVLSKEIGANNCVSQKYVEGNGCRRRQGDFRFALRLSKLIPQQTWSKCRATRVLQGASSVFGTRIPSHSSITSIWNQIVLMAMRLLDTSERSSPSVPPAITPLGLCRSVIFHRVVHGPPSYQWRSFNNWYCKYPICTREGLDNIHAWIRMS